MNNVSDALSREYYDGLYALIAKHQGEPITPLVIATIQNEAMEFRQDFLAKNYGFVENGPVTVDTSYDSVEVNARIMTVFESLERNALEQQRKILAIQMEKDNLIQERSLKNMTRKLRRLFSKHEDKLTPSVRSIWNTLEIYQKLSILKDIDYAERKSKQP